PTRRQPLPRLALQGAEVVNRPPAEKKFWRYVQSGETPHLVSVDGWRAPVAASDRGLRHSPPPQYLAALALRSGYFPPRRRLQPRHLAFAAFDHRVPRIPAQAKHLGQKTTSSCRRLTVNPLDLSP